METKEKLNVYQRLLNARLLISETPIKKGGTNTFSKYDYFTPSQVIQLVSKACKETGLLTVYKLTTDNSTEGIGSSDSYSGCLSIYNVDNPKEVIDFVQPTISPEIKATNAAQKIGGMVTYNERYLKMSAFDIADNNLDFDAQDNTKKATKKATPPKEKAELTDEIFEQMKPYCTKEKYAMMEKRLVDYKSGPNMTKIEILIAKAKLDNGEGTPK